MSITLDKLNSYSMEELVDLFNRNSPESVKYTGKGIDTSWMTRQQTYLYIEQLAGLIMDLGIEDKTENFTYEFYYKLANANDRQRLVAFELFLQVQG